MQTRWIPMMVASIGLALVGCNSNGGNQARTFHGQINVSDYGLHQPVVLVESSNKTGYTAAVSASGSFSVAVPAGQSYRVTLADRTSSGALALVSRVLWSAKGKTFAWAKIAHGSTINFGLIRPLGATTSSAGNAQGQNNDDQGENDDDQCDDDDDAQGDEQGQAGSSGSCQPPMGPPSNPPVCMPGSLGSSKGDRDEDCDQDDHDYGDDDRDDDGGGAQCGDGGVMSGGDDHNNNQGDDNHQGNEDEDDGNGSGGQHCVTHVPTCPPAPGGGTGGTGGAGGTGGSGGSAPPAGTPDMGTGGPIT